MKVPINWLSEYVDINLPIADLAYRLVMSGSEVEEIIDPAARWDDVVVGEVIGLERPPKAERLRVATLDVGGEQLVSVTAAPNIEVGQRVPVVRVGGLVPRGPDGEPFVLQSRPMMGITGDAMVLSERELGLSDEHAGILVLSPETPVGIPLRRVLGDAVLDIAVTANRPDEMSLIGVAREVAATTAADLHLPQAADLDGRARTLEHAGVEITVEAPDLCPRYSAVRIDGVRIGPSPDWLARRLAAAGVRPINNVVDVTNYVMLETGQPLHPFDLSRVADDTVIVRRAQAGETIVTLDGVERSLPPDALVIADPVHAIGIAGVMGGEESEITPHTTSVLLESANFDRTSVRLTSRGVGIRTEASARFERGVAPETTVPALERCLQLIADLMPEPVSVGRIVDVAGPIDPPADVHVPLGEFQRLLGVDVSAPDAMARLHTLGFTCEGSGNSLTVHVPYWRRDVEGPADVVEEVARMIGYDRIPETLPGQETEPPPLPPALRWEAVARDTLWGVGVSEVYTDSLTSPRALARVFTEPGSPTQRREGAEGRGEADAGLGLSGAGDEAARAWRDVVANPGGVERRRAGFEPLALRNPQSVDRSVLRISLVPSLLDVVAHNLKHTEEQLAFFEIARTYFPRVDELPYERRTLAIALCGLRSPRSWNADRREYTFYDLKGTVGALLSHFGVNEGWSVEPPENGNGISPALHPGRSGRLRLNGDELGYLGELHPLVAANFEIEPPVRVFVAELDLDTLMAHADTTRFYRPISRFPSVKRDIALTFPEEVPAARIEATVRAAGGPLLTMVRIVDVYHGESVEAGRKSIAIALEFRSPETTLTQEDANREQDRIVTALERDLGGHLRS